MSAQHIVTAQQKMLKQEAQEAIPDIILTKMVAECEGDQTRMLKNAKRYRQKFSSEILLTRRLAEKALLKKHGLLKTVKEGNEKALSELNKIIKSAEDLKKSLSKISVSEEFENGSLHSLSRHMTLYVHAIDDLAELEDFSASSAKKKLQQWYNFISLLDHHISVFKAVQCDLKSLKRRGRPSTVKMIEGFVVHIAQMYNTLTPKKRFTVCEYGDSDSLTEGMRFAKESMAVLKIPTQRFPIEHKDFLTANNVTDENFHNACDYALKVIRNTRKK